MRAKKLLPQALKSCPKCNQSPNLVTLDYQEDRFNSRDGHVGGLVPVLVLVEVGLNLDRLEDDQPVLVRHLADGGGKVLAGNLKSLKLNFPCFCVLW